MIVVDRIEGDLAIVEVNGETTEVPLSHLPAGCTEGQVLDATGDDAATALLRETRERMNRLRASDPGDNKIEL
jgi:hypothetical protein